MKPTPSLQRRDDLLGAAQSVQLIRRLQDRGVPALWLKRNGQDLIVAGTSRRDIADLLKRILAKQGAV